MEAQEKPYGYVLGELWFSCRLTTVEFEALQAMSPATQPCDWMHLAKRDDGRYHLVLAAGPVAMKNALEQAPKGGDDDEAGG